MNTIHLITLTIHLPETNTQGDVYIYKSWELNKSPFWTQHVEGAPSTKTVSYPMLPYPHTHFEHKYLGESLRFDFESEHFTECVYSEDPSRREIRVIAKFGTVKIRHSATMYKTPRVADANLINMFLKNGWEQILGSEIDTHVE